MTLHPEDQELLLLLDGELPSRPARRIRQHLQGCWACRSRLRSIEASISQFSAVYHQNAVESLPPIEGPRALLKAHLAELRVSAPPPWRPLLWWRMAAAICLCIAAGLVMDRTVPRNIRPSDPVMILPQHSLTPGVAAFTNRSEICAETPVHNRAVSAGLQRRVFERYGLRGANTELFEVDYLITPALGGAEDIRNLWPESYTAVRWNAKAKDALEQQMRNLVCSGQLDLLTAQRELAEDWIAAYKKYLPLESSPLAR